MKTETIDVRSWDDLVFMNRNRDYGAYSVRKSYSRSMITGLGISVSIACLLLIAPKILSQFETVTPPQEPKEEREFVAPISPPKIEQPKTIKPPPPPPTTPAQKPIANVAPTAVTHEVDEELPTNDEIDNAQPTADPNASGGTGPAIADVPPGPPADPTDYGKDFDIVEIPPSFEGGQKGLAQFISRNTRYPSADRRLGTQGTVYVSFVVDKDGNVRDVKVMRGISATCDKEAMRVISMMKGWTPGVQNKHSVSVRMTLPIKFQIAE
ncbi:energy transducer TonB [Pseudochryseolinea flava]|uniref:TonB C-terminal domain-containing protein n=1 Tax=Pseudochryseolinea flava TaxID=2059302 RepID=A0A364XUB2_9BACT|nr:energy transducer TonB [Pseudochryseolinea flava]RAV97899.1 hypothetical protein DQQ10_26455 [Pseudochryseolinea flava]